MNSWLSFMELLSFLKLQIGALLKSLDKAQDLNIIQITVRIEVYYQ